MNKIRKLLIFSWLVFQAVRLDAEQQDLRVAFVRTSPISFGENDKTILFHDEFDSSPAQNSGYFEYTSENKDSFIQVPDEGLEGGGMRACFEKGQVTVGTLKVMFGRKAFSQRGLRPGEIFREIYWRVYVKHEAGWEGNPAKLGRATCLITPEWTQGFIAHVWGGKDNCLCIDPATGIQDSRPVTTHYNDFEHLKWLGCLHGKIPVFSAAESGRWVCVESHVKLNTPGQRDGVFELWVDGKLEAAHTDLDWHGNWQDFAINAVFLENYWNDGSVKKQSRWFDNFVIRTEPVGPVTASRPVSIHRAQASESIPWEAEIASDAEGRDIVWKSNSVPGEALEWLVDSAHGKFAGALADNQTLPEESTYWVRIRKLGQPEWSPWHFPFH